MILVEFRRLARAVRDLNAELVGGPHFRASTAVSDIESPESVAPHAVIETPLDRNRVGRRGWSMSAKKACRFKALQKGAVIFHR